MEEHRMVVEVQTLVVKEHNYGMEELILVSCFMLNAMVKYLIWCDEIDAARLLFLGH